MINLESEFSPRVNPADANYPFGSIKDNTSPGANDGTPLAAVWGNDWEGFAQAAMTEAGIAPSGLPDTAQDSQLLDAVKAVTNGALRPSVIDALRRSYAEAGYNLVDGSFETGGTLVNANDVLLQERTGKAFTGPAGVVAAGTNPASGGFVDRSNKIGKFITPEQFGAKGYPNDDTTALNLAMQEAVDTGKPLYFLRDYGHVGQVTAMPKKHGDKLVVYGNGKTLYRLDWTNTDMFGFCFYRNWDKAPLFKNTAFVVRDLNIDCGFSGNEYDWDDLTSNKPGVSTASAFTSAEVVVLRNFSVVNSQRHGFVARWLKVADIDGFRTENLGGHAYEAGDHDSYSDPLLFRYIEDNAQISISRFKAVALGYPGAPMSRIGVSCQKSQGSFVFNIRDAIIKGFERALHFEELDSFYVVNIDNLIAEGAQTGVLVTKGSSAISVRPTVNISNSSITVCKNSYYKEGMFKLTESTQGWVRYSIGSTEDASLGATFNVFNTKFKLQPALDGVLYEVPWGGNVNIDGSSVIDYSNKTCVKQSGYTRIKNSIIKGISTSGFYFFPWRPDTTQVSVELDRCTLELDPGTDTTVRGLYHHGDVLPGPNDRVENCIIKGHIKLPIDESSNTSNLFVFKSVEDFDNASQVGNLSLSTSKTGEFPPKGCRAQIGSLLYSATATANSFVAGGFVDGNLPLTISSVIASQRTGIYTLVIRPTTVSTSVAMAISSPTTVGNGKNLQIVNVLSGSAFSVSKTESYGRDQALDSLKIDYDAVNKQWTKNPTTGSAVVNIVWALFSGNISDSIYKGPVS